jgi:hypothetical protein
VRASAGEKRREQKRRTGRDSPETSSWGCP